MNILHVISSVHKNGGGTSEVVPRLCRAQKEAGHDVTIAVAHQGDVSNAAIEAFGAGVTYAQFPCLRFLRSLGLSPTFRKGIVSLVQNADVVHLHGLWQAPCWYAAAECRRQHKPYVMMPHGFLEPERLKISKWKKRLVGRLVERRNFKYAAALVATSESEAKGLRQCGLRNPIHIMPIGLDLDPFLPLIEHKQKTLLYFSRMTPIKGLDMLAEAWACLARETCEVKDKGSSYAKATEDREGERRWKLLLVGPDDRGYVEEAKRFFAEKCPVGSYEFRGPVFGADKYKLLASVDAMVLPTRSENWSIAVAEGMAAGLPVVCTKGAPWPCLRENWVDISVAGLEAGLRRVLSRNDSERMAIGIANREWVSKNLRWQDIASQTIDLYKRILSRQPRGRGGAKDV